MEGTCSVRQMMFVHVYGRFSVNCQLVKAPWRSVGGGVGAQTLAAAHETRSDGACSMVGHV